MRDFRGHAVPAWLIAIGALIADYEVFGAISPRMPRLMLITITCGILWVAAGFRIRRHVGTAAHIGCSVGAAAVTTVMFRGIATDALDLNSELGTAALFGYLVLPFVASAVSLHHPSMRTDRPPLRREFPVALAAFGIALAVGGFVTSTLLVLGLPRIP